MLRVMSNHSYKQVIRRQLLKERRANPALRNFHLAEKLNIEASYLSRFFSDASVHFSDELLFSLLKALRMDHDAIDQVVTLKEFERCVHPERKRFLEEKLALLKVKRLRHEFDRINASLHQTLEILNRNEN